MEGSGGKLKERKMKQGLFYNKGTNELPELQPKDTVRMRMKPLPTTMTSCGERNRLSNK